MQSNKFSAVFLSENFSNNDWYIDSGASIHLTANENWFMNASFEPKKDIVVAKNENVIFYVLAISKLSLLQIISSMTSW